MEVKTLKKIKEKCECGKRATGFVNGKPYCLKHYIMEKEKQKIPRRKEQYKGIMERKK